MFRFQKYTVENLTSAENKNLYDRPTRKWRLKGLLAVFLMDTHKSI